MNVYDARALLLADSPAEARGLAEESLAGDMVADAILGDLLLEGDMGEKVYPFVVGDKVMLFTLTLYFLGEVAEVGRGWVPLVSGRPLPVQRRPPAVPRRHADARPPAVVRVR